MIEVGDVNLTVRRNSFLADAKIVSAAALTRAPHPAPILGARLQIQKRDPTENGGGEHDPGDGYDVHLFYTPIGVGDTRLVLTNDFDLRSFNPSRGRSGDARIARGCHDPILRPLAVASLAARPSSVSCPRRARSLTQAASLRSHDRSGRTATKDERSIAPRDRRDPSKDTAVKASYSPLELLREDRSRTSVRKRLAQAAGQARRGLAWT